MRTILTCIIALIMTVFAAEAQTVINLSSFNTSFSEPVATTTFSPTTTLRIGGPETAFIPANLPDGGYITLDIRVAINAGAASWQTAGNLLTVGLLENNAITNVFDASHADDSLLYFQNNSGGSGTFWNTKFLAPGDVFVFGNGGDGGYANDNAGQTAPLNGSFVDYAVTLQKNGSFTASVTYLDPLGVAITNTASIGSNPEVLTGVTNPNVAVVPVLRYRNGDGPAGSGFQSSNATLTVVPEPSSVLLLGASIVGIAMHRRRR